MMFPDLILLTAAIVILWFSPVKNGQVITVYWIGLFFLAIAAGLYVGRLSWPVLPVALLFGGACYGFTKSKGAGRWLLGTGVLLMALGLGLHLLPGFHNPQILDKVQLSPDSIPYSLYLNFDKAMVGLFILAFMQPLINTSLQWRDMIRQLLPMAGITISIVILVSMAVGYIRFDPKWPDFLLYWLWINLFITCLAEEALFRGFLQQQLIRLLLPYKYGPLIAITICAALFGLAHIGGGLTYVFLATVAGLGYGLAYHKTGRIEAAVLLHFMLNTVHILFFSYPALIGIR
ncbi:MAG: CPBP family intramembrane metalloprotease [Gammaproteobacteria bacterium]|nr:CPBP family intramembrane metalloprotease [Gammaproteobacteria bacterium]MDH5653019.1 CPBP family intramembrane metalloprotease [Gammaproteobacteria bacterium]